MVKGKVVLVLFPFDDLTSAKLRPAVCLTDPIGSHRHVVLAFITKLIKNYRNYLSGNAISAYFCHPVFQWPLPVANKEEVICQLRIDVPIHTSFHPIWLHILLLGSHVLSHR